MPLTLPHFLESGSGAPVLLLHGIGSAAESWHEVQQDLAERFRVIAWDAPGYGLSPPLPSESPEAGHYAEALWNLWQHLGLGAVHLVGHSLGALVAARFAATRPKAARSLTLMSAAIGHGSLPEAVRQEKLNSRLSHLERLGPQGLAEKRGPSLLSRHARPDQIQQVVRVMARVHPRGYTQAARMLSQGNLEEDLHRLSPRLPVQFIVGTEDAITPPESNERAARFRERVPFHRISQAGHAVYVEAPTRTGQMLKAFFESVDDQR
jgi:pimeloyl-ACP methyl ester carboxylesterase